MPPTFHPFAAYGAALALTLVLACYLTPRAWWRRPTVRGLLILAGGTCVLGALLLPAPPAAAPVPAPPRIAAAATAPPAPPFAGHAYRVHRDLNLRVAPGVQATRLATVPVGATVTPTGLHEGDWWQVRAGAGGPTGWASSLWLRQQLE